jgi:FkbM family methyltransferase
MSGVWMQRAALGFRNPALALRYLRRKSEVNDIELSEIDALIPKISVVLEAGAMDGQDTVRMATQWAGSRIFAFEPVPGNYELLVTATEQLGNVETFQMAVGIATGKSTLHLSASEKGQGASTSSSLLSPHEHLDAVTDVTFEESVEVDVVNLDEWCAERQVAVDFAWLDLQGMELDSLKASPRFVSGLSAAVLEVSRRELYRGMPLYEEVVDWMQSQGLRIVIDRVTLTSGNILFARR